MPDLTTDEVLERIEESTYNLRDVLNARSAVIGGALPVGTGIQLWLIEVLDNKTVELKSRIAVLVAGITPDDET